MATKVKLIADGVITPDQITLTTASTGTNTTAPATTAFVQQEIASLVDSSPDALNTLNELAAALGDDANFSTTVTNSIATKAPLATPQFTNRVGIGVAAHASAALNITSTAQHMRLNNGSELGIIHVLSSGELELWGHGDGESINFRTGSGSGTVAMNVVGTNVGIGTDNPTNALVLKRESAGQGEFGLRLEYNDTQGPTQTSSAVLVGNYGIKFKNYNSSRDFLFETGDVGIGTGSDTLNGTLNVKGGVNSITAYSTTTTDQPGLFAGNNSAFNTSTNTLYAKIYGSGISASSFGVTLADYAIVAAEGTDNNGLLIGSFNSAPVIFGTNNTNRMTLTADGKLNLNVALTKSSGPVLDLEPNANIDGSYYSALTINEQHSTAHSGVRFDRSGTAKYRVGIDNNDNFQIANFRTTTDDAAFVMDVDGDIGIGTASPATSLHIHRDASENTPGLRLTTGKDSGTPTAQIEYSTGSGYFLRLPDAANNEDVMIRSYGDTIFHGGSVSIGDQLKVGSFTSGQTNTGEAWLGRASDRNEGTLTVQLGGGTTGRKFEIVDHDWAKVLMSIDGNAEGGSLIIPATEGGSGGNTGIIMKNRHPGNAEPYTSLDVRELQTTNGYGGIGMYSNLQSHLRFKTGGGATTWGNGTGHQWQLRMGNGAAEDQMEFYAWTGNKRVHRMYGSNGAHTMEYQLGGRFGLPSNQTVTTSWSNLNFSDTNSTYLMYNQGLTNSSGEITVPVAGRYAISARFRTEATPFQAPTQFAIYVDNSGSGSGTFVQIVRLYITSNTQSSYEHAPPLDTILNLIAGARFVVRAISGSGSFVLSSTSNTVNHLSVMKLA